MNMLYVFYSALKDLQLLKWTSPDGVVHRYRLINHVSAKWKKFGQLISLTENKMENWAKDSETDNEGRWVKVMEAWLEGQGQDAYPPTWQGLFEMLEDVQFGGVVPALKEAVESAIPQGMFVFCSHGCEIMCHPIFSRQFMLLGVFLKN